MTTFTRITIDTNTHALLTRLSTTKGKSMSRLVADWAQAEANAAGVSPSSDMGVAIYRWTAGADAIVMFSLKDIPGAPLVCLDPDEAVELARQIDRTVTARSHHSFTTKRGSRKIAIFRRGRGVIIATNEAERAVTEGIARCVAQALRDCFGPMAPAFQPASPQPSAPQSAATSSSAPDAGGWTVTYNRGATGSAPPDHDTLFPTDKYEAAGSAGEP